MAFSAAIEMVQLGIPRRHARLRDFLVDAVSASTGVGLAFIGENGGGPGVRLRKRQKRKAAKKAKAELIAN